MHDLDHHDLSGWIILMVIEVYLLLHTVKIHVQQIYNLIQDTI